MDGRIDIAAAHAKNPNYREDIAARVEHLQRVNIDIEKMPQEQWAEQEHDRHGH